MTTEEVELLSTMRGEREAGKGKQREECKRNYETSDAGRTQRRKYDASAARQERKQMYKAGEEGRGQRQQYDASVSLAWRKSRYATASPIRKWRKYETDTYIMWCQCRTDTCWHFM